MVKANEMKLVSKHSRVRRLTLAHLYATLHLRWCIPNPNGSNGSNFWICDILTEGSRDDTSLYRYTDPKVMGEVVLVGFTHVSLRLSIIDFLV